jgi:hypothetical protein
MPGLLHFCEDAIEVVGLRRLHRREFLVRQQLLFPEQLAVGGAVAYRLVDFWLLCVRYATSAEMF